MSAPPHWPLIPLHPPARFTPWGRSLGAFTLVELLVVIAILAVLAAIAIPVLGGMAEKGNSVKCVNNLRQIGGAIGMYAAENNGFLPSSSGYNYTGAGAKSFGFSHWQAPLPCLLGVGQVAPTGFPARADYESPSAKHPFNCPACKTHSRTYAANMHAMGFLPGGSAYKAKKMASIPTLSKVVLIADDTAGDAGPNNSGKDNFNSADYGKLIGTRHGGKANVLFGDLHIEALDPASLNASTNIKQP
jgi:prepilin-type N-terminal cleavage/methylation domain-containing protein/prepilin-type processing-associated H-X9-DG protein